MNEPSHADIKLNEGKNSHLTVRDAGRRGGLTTLENKGRSFYRQIGKKGGQRTKELYGNLLSEFGKNGGRPKRPSLNENMKEEDRK